LNAGVARDLPDFNRIMETHFDALMQRAEAQMQAAAAQLTPTAEPTPAFFEPPPSPPEPAPPPENRAHIVSAPVSRRDAGGYREPSPSSVRLTPAELEVARSAGISTTEYARHKLRMEREKRSGERQCASPHCGVSVTTKPRALTAFTKSRCTRCACRNSAGPRGAMVASGSS
jgi:hypothetical protein